MAIVYYLIIAQEIFPGDAGFGGYRTSTLPTPAGRQIAHTSRTFKLDKAGQITTGNFKEKEE
jgi:hypothetical protein